MRFDSDATEDFFETRTATSKRKAEIVVAFYKGWAQIMERQAVQFLYVDLFAGRGYYDRCETDPALVSPIPSTPLLILSSTIENVRFREGLSALFNDGLQKNADDLQAQIDKLPGVDLLRHRPEVTVGAVEKRFAELINGGRLKQRKPAFFFFDPFGYKAISRRLIADSLEDWGCDVAFFVNYNRLNMAFGHHLFDSHLIAMFGAERVEVIRDELKPLNGPEQREDCIMKHLQEALREIGGAYFISYRFRNHEGRTSHHLAFTSKHYRGYAVMKEKMAQFSEKTAEGIPLFEFVAPSDSPQFGMFAMPTMFPPRHFPWNISALSQDILNTFRGDRLTLEQLFQRHNVNTPYVLKNYRDAIWRLVDANAGVTLVRPKSAAVKHGTCPPDTSILF